MAIYRIATQYLLVAAGRSWLGEAEPPPSSVVVEEEQSLLRPRRPQTARRREAQRAWPGKDGTVIVI